MCVSVLLSHSQQNTPTRTSERMPFRVNLQTIFGCQTHRAPDLQFFAPGLAFHYYLVERGSGLTKKSQSGQLHFVLQASIVIYLLVAKLFRCKCTSVYKGTLLLIGNLCQPGAETLPRDLENNHLP